MGCGQVDLLGDGHEADIPSPKSLQKGDLLRCVTAQTVHSDHHNSVCTGTAGVEQMGNFAATWTLRQEPSAAHSPVANQLNQRGSHGLTPGQNAGFLSVE